VRRTPQQILIVHETFSFETAQLQKVGRQVAAVRTMKKTGWLGITSKEVEENYTETVYEWLVQKSSCRAKRFIEDLGNGVEIEMVAIPGGEFLMGAPITEQDSRDNERPQHRVKMSSFYMGKYPVTQVQYEALLGNNPSRFKGRRLPVEMVSWHDAQDFCQRLESRSQKKYCLPSEAQWEYACRAGTNTPFYYGETINTDLANYDGNYIYGSGSKGKFQETKSDVRSLRLGNSFGLYDMHGNVWEWCEDHYSDSYQQVPSDGSAWVDFTTKAGGSRVLRGGSWVNLPSDCRSAYRYWGFSDYRDSDIDFRVVYSP
jgi:formylglycine-generating enzyme required for sulfatase activity